MVDQTVIQSIHQSLLAHFGTPKWETRPAVDELILTILSQNTNDKNRDVAYSALRQALPAWRLVHRAPTTEVIAAIRPAGLAEQKAPRIQKVLSIIHQQFGEYDLSALKKMPKEAVRQWLLALDGVGPKTAAIVMLFSLGFPAFPVDTHIYRVSGRLGLRAPDLSVEKTHQFLESLIPEELFGSLHLNLIYLGRQICQARKPLCAQCPVSDYCQYVKADK